MGYWDSTLYGNDTTEDIRDEYRKLLEDQKTDEEAYRGILDQFGDMIGTDEEPFLWYALADSMWKHGRLMEEVRKKALDWIGRDGGIQFWEKYPDEAKGWKRTLQRLQKKITSPMPKRRNVRKPKPVNGDLWNLYDIYAYRFPEDADKYLVFENDFEKSEPFRQVRPDSFSLKNKYILIQKIGSLSFYHKPIMQVRVFAEIFDALPSLSDLQDITLLPFNHPKRIPEKKRLQTSGAARVWFRNSEYPKSRLYYVGNKTVIFNAESPIEKPESSIYNFSWEFVFRDIGNKLLQWKGRKYYEEEPGVYVYDPADPWLSH